MHEIKLRIQVLQAARRISRTEPCDWSEGCNNNVGGGVTAGKASVTK